MKAIMQWMDRDLGGPILAATALLAGALGLEVVPELVAPPAPNRALAFAIPSAPTPLRVAPVLAVRTASKIASPAAPLTLNEFIHLAKKAAPAPVAERFAKEFAGEPALAEALKAFQREQGGEAPAREFFGRMSRLPQFASLMGKFQSDAGFQQAFASVTRDPRAEAALRGGVEPELASSGPLARRSVGSAAGKRAVVAPSNGAGAQGASMAQRVTSSTVPGGPGAALTPISPAAFGSSSAQGSTNGAQAGPRSAAGAGEAHSPVAAAVPPLIEKTHDAACVVESLFSAAPKSLRDILDKTCEIDGICDPVAACKAAGVMDQCMEVARANPGCAAAMSTALAGASASSVPEIGDDKVVDPGLEKDGSRSLGKSDTPSPAAVGVAQPTLLQRIAEGTGRVAGTIVGFVLGGGLFGNPFGALDEAARGGDIGATMVRGAVDAVTSFFGSLF